MDKMLRSKSGLFCDPSIQQQVLDTMRTFSDPAHKAMVSVAARQEWVELPVKFKLNGTITDEQVEGFAFEDVELALTLRMLRRYTFNGCNVYLELVADKVVGAASISDISFKNITGLDFSLGEDHYGFILTLVERGQGVLEDTFTVSQVTKAIIDTWTPEKSEMSMDTEWLGFSCVVRLDDSKEARLFVIDAVADIGGSKLTMGNTWFIEEKVTK